MKVQEYSSQAGRVGAILALIAAVASLAHPIRISDFNAINIITIISTFAVWSAIELSDFQKTKKLAGNSKDSDVQKLNNLLTLIDKDQFYVLKNLPIQTYIETEDYKKIGDIIRHKETDIFPFYDKEIQEMYEDFCRKSAIFLQDLYTLYTSCGNGRATWRPSGAGYVSNEEYDIIRLKIRDLDNLSTDLANTWERFIILSKNKLKESTIEINEY